MTESRLDLSLYADPGHDPRVEGFTHGERGTLLDYLDNYRLTLAVKCAGLTPEQLATRSVPPSALSLLGLVRHVGGVEHSWWRRVMGRDLALTRLYRDEQGKDTSFVGAEPTQECVDAAFEVWRREVANADDYLAGVDDLGAPGTHSDGEVELREVLVHLIEEYARHCGHADLLRECLDGRTGD